MIQGSIAKWFKKEGEFVEADELLAEISTDKATVEYRALDEGFLRKIVVEEGREVPINTTLALFSKDKEESLVEFVEKAPTPEKSTVPLKQKIEPTTKPPSTGTRLKVTPLARKLALEQGIDLKDLRGTGPGGRITSRDLKGKREVGLEKTEGRPEKAALYEERPLSRLRAVLARRLVEAKQTIPHFYIEQVINAAHLLDFRSQLHEVKRVAVTFNDCVTRAVALSLKAHPEINSGFNRETNQQILFKSVDVAIAVSLEEGLITPIIRQADTLSLFDISLNIKALARKAREGKLEMHEFQGASFTISNLGMYGITRFQAIINPPQGAILAVGGIVRTPVVQESNVIPGHVMHLTLSLDHRIIDGVQAAQFLKTVQNYLENPASLL